jgi:hypothetical protein
VESRATTHGVRGAELRTGLTGRKGCKAGGPGFHPGLVELALQAAIAKPSDAAWAKRDCQHTWAKVQTRGLHGCDGNSSSAVKTLGNSKQGTWHLDGFRREGRAAAANVRRDVTRVCNRALPRASGGCLNPPVTAPPKRAGVLPAD